MLIGDIYRLTAGVLNSTDIKYKYNAGSWDSDIHNRQDVSDIYGGHSHTGFDVLVFNSIMSFEEPEDLRVIDHADSTFIICTEDNPIQVLIYITVKSFMLLKAVSRKKCPHITTNHFDICGKFFGLLVHNRYWPFNNHHTSQIYISDTQHANEINVYTTNHVKKHVQASGHLCIHTRRKIF